MTQKKKKKKDRVSCIQNRNLLPLSAQPVAFVNPGDKILF